RCQTLGWLFVAGVAASSARTWAAKWGEFHTDRTTFLGASKTFGFMAMDLLAAKVLHNVNGSFGVWLLDGLAEKVGCIVNSVQLLLCDAHPGAAPPSDRLRGLGVVIEEYEFVRRLRSRCDVCSKAAV
ncbi:unnamed protein product, partial [Prorocentrum cordatum]